MPADYSGQNLRGRNFRGKNLEGANFSGADIRSADFSGAILVGASFSHAEAGLQMRWFIFLSLVWSMAQGLSGFLSAFASYSVAYLIFNTQKNYQIAGWTVITTLVGLFFVTIRQGIQVGLEAFAGVLALTGSLTFAVAVAGVYAFTTPTYIYTYTFPTAGYLALAFAFAVVLAVAVAGSLAVAVAGSLAEVFEGPFFARGGVLALIDAASTTVSHAVTIAFLFDTYGYSFIRADSSAALFTGVVAGALVLFSTYISLRTLEGDPKHALIRNIAIAFAAISGTSFRSADLTDANFTEATLKSTDLRKANLTRTCWQNTKKLDRARPGTTYLQNTQLRQLLVRGLGQDKHFDRQDLRGVNLQGANLTAASFIDTDMSQANLQSANLFEAKLVRTNLDHANLSYAHLTGAYIEDWGITRKTRLDSVECKYVYLKLPTEGDRDPNRMPPSEQGDFGENDFNIFITSVLDTLDLYHKQDINAAIAITVLKGLTRDYPVQFELVGLEKRGNDQFLIRLKVFGPTSHFQLQREYYARYEQTLPLYDPKKLMPDTDILVEEIIKTVKENPGTRIENLHNEGIFITGGNVNMTAEQNRNINTGGGNYNENIEGDYIQGDYSPER